MDAQWRSSAGRKVGELEVRSSVVVSWRLPQPCRTDGAGTSTEQARRGRALASGRSGKHRGRTDSSDEPGGLAVMQHRTSSEWQKLQGERQKQESVHGCVRNGAVLVSALRIAVPGGRGRGRDESRTLARPLFHCLEANELLCTSGRFRWVGTAGSRFQPSCRYWGLCTLASAPCKPVSTDPSLPSPEGAQVKPRRAAGWPMTRCPRLAHVSWHRRAFAKEGLAPLGHGRRLSWALRCVRPPSSPVRGGGGAARSPAACATALSNAEAIVAGGQGGRLACPCCPGTALPGGPASLSISRPSRSASSPGVPSENAMRSRGRAGTGSAKGPMHQPSAAQPHRPPRARRTRRPAPPACARPAWSACWRVTGCRLRLGTSTIGQPPCNRPLLASERDCIPLAGPSRPLRPKPAQPSPTLRPWPFAAGRACQARPYQMAVVAIEYGPAGPLRLAFRAPSPSPSPPLVRSPTPSPDRRIRSKARRDRRRPPLQPASPVLTRAYAWRPPAPPAS